MKQAFSLLLALVMCMTICACTPVQSPQNNPQQYSSTVPSTPPSTSSQKKEVQLTADNILTYLTIQVKTDNTKVEDAGYNGMEKGNTNIIVQTSAKKRCEFDSVVITLMLKTSSSGWCEMDNREIEISYDGNSETTFRGHSLIADYVSDNPLYTVEVVAVNGIVIVE